MDTLAQDIRFGLRQLRRTPGFTVAAVLALALGIGATTAIFSVLDRVVLRPLPYPDPDRLTMVWEVNDSKGLSHERISPVNFGDYHSPHARLRGCRRLVVSAAHAHRNRSRAAARQRNRDNAQLLPRARRPAGARRRVPEDAGLLARDDRDHQPSAVARAVRRRSVHCRQEHRAERSALHRRRRDAAGVPVSQRHRRVAPHHMGRDAAQPRRTLHGVAFQAEARHDAGRGEHRTARVDQTPRRGEPVDQR